MDKYFRSIIGFIKLLTDSIMSSFKILLISKFNLKLPQTKNTKCIVLANGTSLNSIYESNKSIFAGNDCIVSNKFAESQLLDEIKPIYYVMLDPYMMSSKSFDTNYTFEKLKNKVNLKMCLLVPFHFRNEIRLKTLGTNKNIEVRFFNYTYYKGFNTVGNWFYRKNLACPRALSVINSALYLGINIGYKEIFLVGADQNWFKRIKVNDQNILMSALDHFYDQSNEVQYKPYFKGGDEKNKTVKISEFFWIQMKTFEGYDNIRKYADYSKCNIYNASIDSYIDSFEKRTIENIQLK